MSSSRKYFIDRVLRERAHEQAALRMRWSLLLSTDLNETNATPPMATLRTARRLPRPKDRKKDRKLVVYTPDSESARAVRVSESDLFPADISDISTDRRDITDSSRVC
jgi:hypothetical protein